MKTAALAIAFMVWATATFAQQANSWNRDFESVTPQFFLPLFRALDAHTIYQGDAFGYSIFSLSDRFDE
jgi:hypothetical protein